MKAAMGKTPVKVFCWNGVKYKVIKVETRKIEGSDKSAAIWKVKRID